jgi:hypothetical protein
MLIFLSLDSECIANMKPGQTIEKQKVMVAVSSKTTTLGITDRFTLALSSRRGSA